MKAEFFEEDLAGFLDRVVYPSLWLNLDSAFPEFNFERSEDFWEASNGEHTRRLQGAPAPRQIRVYRHIPFGMVVERTEFIPWSAYLGEDNILEAARGLAGRAEIAFPDQSFPPEELKRLEKMDRRTQLLETFVIATRTALMEDGASTVRARLDALGIPSRQLPQLEIGYCPAANEVRAILANRGFTDPEIEASGILSPWWEDRLVGPWRNRNGRIINIWGWRCEESLDAPETESRIRTAGPTWLFQINGSKDSPFGLDHLRGREPVLVGDILDVLALRAHGFPDAVSLADAPMSSEQIRALSEGGIRHLALNFDYDPQELPCEKHGESFCMRCFPGFFQTLRAVDQLNRAPFSVSVVDPCSMADVSDISERVSARGYLYENGLEGYRTLIANAPRAILFRTETILRDHDLTTDAGKDAAVEAFLSYDGHVHEEHDRQLLWKQAAEATGYSYNYLYSRAQSRAGYRDRERMEREVAAMLEDARTDLEQSRVTPEGLIARLSKRIEGLQGELRADQPEPFAVDPLIETVKNAGEGKFSGWTTLDRMGIRFQPGELVVAGSRTGHGKTTFLLSLMLNWLENYAGEHFIYYSYEVPVDAAMIKMASAMTRRSGGKGWTYYGIRSRLRRYEEYDQEGQADLNRAFDLLRGWEDRLQFVYRPTWNIDDLCAHARQTAAQAGRVGGILVDYLQLVPSPPGEDHRAEGDASAVARRLKVLAVDLKCPVVAAAQISRDVVEKNPVPIQGNYSDGHIQAAIRRRAPQLHHMRDSGAEQAADLVLGLLNYRADFLNERMVLDAEERGKPGRLEVLALKNRYGGLGQIGLVFEGWTSTIRDREKQGEV